MRRRLGLLIGLAVTLALGGCASAGDLPANANATAVGVSVKVGSSSAYSLYTHCGVLSATFNGQTFYAAPPLSDGQGNPPRGWGNPYDAGRLTVTSETTVDFQDASGHFAHFAAAAYHSSVPICS